MKVAIVVLDGGTWNLLYPWIKKNRLPNFSKIIKRGVYGNLRSVIPPITIPAIPAFYTGKNPGKIGLYGFTKDNASLVSSFDIKDKCIWDFLGELELKSALINLPLTYPPKKVNGILITGYPTPSYDKTYTYPSSLSERLDFPGDIVSNERFYVKDIDNLADEQIEITRKRFDIAKRLVGESDYQFSILFIKGTDVLQHVIWDKQEDILKYYEFLDKIIKEWIDLNKGANFFIISDHGFDACPSYKFHLNTWLKNEGCLEYKKGQTDKYIQFMYRQGRRFLPLRIKHSFSKKIRKETPKGEEVPLLNMCKTTAFRDGFGIRLNVSNKDEYKRKREEIINKLKKLSHENTLVIKEIHKREDVYSGPFISDIPDIVFLLNENYIASPPYKNCLFSSIDKELHFQGAPRTGTHHSSIHGIFIAFGPDVKVGKQIDTACLIDITPTILNMFNIPIPSDIDGKVLNGIFKSESELSTRKVVYQNVRKINRRVSLKKAYNREDKEKIKKSLRNLGYID